MTLADGTLLVDASSGALSVPRFAAHVVSGQDVGRQAGSEDGRLTVGTGGGATLELSDPTVSRFHVEFEASGAGIAIRDLGSTNGTFVGALQIREIVVRGPVDISVGRSVVRLVLGGERAALGATGGGSFGGLIGSSAPMRAVFAVLERAAPTTVPVLILGESGTGKELCARAIHAHSPRADGPFEVVDCGGLPPTLIESELFGHERGAFTGATSDHEGAFERADGGTLFLDELGEMPLELQPKLLRVLGEREVRRLGGKKTSKVDVRVVAATNRDLRRLVNSGHFRSDLYYRLAVVQVRLPPLRDRLDDLPGIVRALLDAIARDRGLDVHLEPDAELLAPLSRHAWPGNIRELRNYLEQLVILRVPPALGGPDSMRRPGQSPGAFDGLDHLPLRAAKGELIERFERHYLERLLETTGGNVAEAARRAGVDRGTLFRTIRRYGLRAQ